MTQHPPDQLRRAWDSMPVSPAPADRVISEGRTQRRRQRRRRTQLVAGGAVVAGAIGLLALQALPGHRRAEPVAASDSGLVVFVTTGGGMPVTASTLAPTFTLSSTDPERQPLPPSGPTSPDGRVSWAGVENGDYTLEAGIGVNPPDSACSVTAHVDGSTQAVLTIAEGGGCELDSVGAAQAVVPWVQNSASVSAAQSRLEAAGFTVHLDYVPCAAGFCKEGVVGTVPEAFTVVARGSTITVRAR
jgi:hypothetical protein